MASVKLIEAIAAFEDETSKLTLGERIDNLRSALMWEAFQAIKLGNEHSKTDTMKHFNDLEKMYANQLKLNKLIGKSNDKVDDEFLAAIRGMKSSVSEIVRDLK